MHVGVSQSQRQEIGSEQCARHSNGLVALFHRIANRGALVAEEHGDLGRVRGERVRDVSQRGADPELASFYKRHTNLQPGQVLERSLGFDFSTRVEKSSVLYKRLFASFPSASGMQASTAAAVGVPITSTTHLLNFFLQYKRPEFFALGHRSRPWSPSEEFLRFKVVEKVKDPSGAWVWDFSQVKALRRLQTNLAGSGLVRYACPSSWTKDDLYSRFHGGDLVDTTTFVDPSALEVVGSPGSFHKYWTFSAADLSKGIPNPDGPKAESGSGRSIFDRLSRSVPAPAGSERSTDELVTNSRDLEEGNQALREVRENKSRPERREDDRERDALTYELGSFRGPERVVISASLEIAAVARDLKLRWAIVLFQ
jgi:hypothetical protein